MPGGAFSPIRFSMLTLKARASAGSIAEGISVSMDIEQLIYEAGRLHDAASLLNRLSQA